MVAEARQPNVIVFYTDDHGWADLGIHGQRDDVQTPHLDRLATKGLPPALFNDQEVKWYEHYLNLEE